jgi:hypothetical protein
MSYQPYSQKFLSVVAEANKQPIIVVEVEGLNTIITSGTTYKNITYGSGYTFGEAGVYYGLSIPIPTYTTSASAQQLSNPILSLDKSSLTISQQIEPEQGRSSVSMLNLAFIDKNQFMTQLVSPGILIPDILGAQVKVRVGFPQISYPNDYLLLFRGRVSSYDSTGGLVTIQTSDPNIVRRQQLFYTAQTNAASAISSSATTLPVVTTGGFNQQILGPNGQYDPAITTYIQVDSEIMQYPATGITVVGSQPTFAGLIRGARGTSAVSHSAGAQVTSVIQVQDTMINMALKFMLSGWQGPYITGLKVISFVQTNDALTGTQSQGFVIDKDAVIEYGISPGDYITITGASNSGNNVTCVVLYFLDTTIGPNRVIITNTTFITEFPTTAVYSVRSQYDTYPDNLGLQMPAYEVDVAAHRYIQSTFMSSAENSLTFLMTETQSSAKTFIESEIYFPFGCYSLTRFGRCSMQLTHPPIAGQTIQVLNQNNVVNPQNISPSRAVNNRKFFNELDLFYDYSDSQSYQTVNVFLATNSLNIIGISSVLQIQSSGLRSNQNFPYNQTNPNTSGTSVSTINRIFDYILSRYQNGAIVIKIEVNFATGIQIEAGDVVEISDNGFLNISNFLTGQRNLGSQLFEVINRNLNLGTGKCTLQVITGLGSLITDRYATFAPATILGAPTNQSLLSLTASFGSQSPLIETLKWTPYLGLRVKVHAPDWSNSATCILNSISATYPNAINVSGFSIPASAGPSAGWIMQPDDYSQSSSILDQQPFKIAFDFFDPSVMVTSGSSPTSFVVASSGIGLFTVGLPVLVHDKAYANISNEVNVLSVAASSNTVTVNAPLGFTPSAGNLVELIGFVYDGSGPYRWI